MAFDTPKDSTAIYIKKAEDIKTPYKLRILYTEKAVACLMHQNNDSLNSDMLIKMANNFNRLNSWSNLKTLTQKVLDRSIEKNDDYFIGQSYRWLGVYYENASLNDSAFYCYLQAEKVFKKLGDDVNLCNIFQDKAQIQYYEGDFLGAEYSLTRALVKANRLNIGYQKIRILTSLGLNSMQLNDIERGFIYHKRALKLASEKINVLYEETEIICLNNIAGVYLTSRNFHEATRFIQESLKKNSFEGFIKYPQHYCYSLQLLGRIKMELREYNGIEKLFLEISRIRDSLNIDQGKNYNKLYLSEYYQATKQNAKAQKFAFEAYNLSKSYRNAGDMLECLKQLSKVDTKNALKYSQEYIKISDSMQQLERVTRNKFAKIAYETEEIIQQKEAAVKKNWIISGISALVILILVLLFIIKLQRAKQKQLQLQQIQQQESEVTYNLLLDQQSKIDKVRSTEKKRIAQDLHDGVMNRLASTRLNLQNIAENTTSETMKKCRAFIDGIQDIEKEIRDISHDLNTRAFSSKGSLVAMIETFVEEQKRLSDCNYHLEIDKSIQWEVIAGFKKIHIFRIIQEAIQNINKHAYAKNVIISIIKNEGDVLLEIFDDGIGFSLNKKKKGIGLQNIYSRAKSCKGNAEFKSKENIGTTIIIKIPI